MPTEGGEWDDLLPPACAPDGADADVELRDRRVDVDSALVARFDGERYVRYATAAMRARADAPLATAGASIAGRLLLANVAYAFGTDRELLRAALAFIGAGEPTAAAGAAPAQPPSTSP